MFSFCNEPLRFVDIVLLNQNKLIFTEVFPYDRHGHRKKTCILDNDCRNCVPLGPKGDKGAQGLKGDKGQAASSGVKYVRWGKTTCPNGAQIVYKGTKRR